MNLQTGRICCLILILLAALETKAQVALEENNIEQYASCITAGLWFHRTLKHR